MTVVEVPYFVYNEGCPKAKIQLNSNPLRLLERIENGENLFIVLPDFNAQKERLPLGLQMSFPYGKFETRRQIHRGGEVFDSREKPVQVGKLLIPYYNILTREKIEELLMSERANSPETVHYTKTLREFPNVKIFCKSGTYYKPINKDILVLTKGQLE